MARPKPARPATSGRTPARSGLLPSRPRTFGEFIRSGWFAYLTLLPTGALIVVLLALVVFDSDGGGSPAAGGLEDPYPEGTPHALFPNEFALQEAVNPAEGEIPAEGVTEAGGGHAFFALLRAANAPVFQPWRSYVWNPDLAGVRGWVDRNGEVVSQGLFASFDEEGARAAFAALREMRGGEALSFTAAGELLREYGILTDPGLGDESLAYRLVHGVDAFQSETAVIPARDIEVTAIWVRVGGTILFAARNGEFQAGAGPTSGLLAIEELIRAMTARVAAFQPPLVDESGAAIVGPLAETETP